jgi:hypothetical protein
MHLFEQAMFVIKNRHHSQELSRDKAQKTDDSSMDETLCLP